MKRSAVSNPQLGGGRSKKALTSGRNCHRKHVEDGSILNSLSEKCGGVLHGKYELGRLLGHGTFAKVYLARNLQTNRSVAMKVVGKEKVIRVGMMEQVKREISVMKMVHHPNIVELHEVLATKTKIYLSMELVRGGELFAKIARGRLREDTARRYFHQLISAIDFCHSRGVYHRDLKPENLLLDDQGNLKVTDFGLSALPDHLRHDGYDGAKADIWSCGVILYTLLAGYLPFQDGNIVSLYKKIYRGDFKCPPWLSPESRKLIGRMLEPNPGARISLAKIMSSSWFKKSMPVAKDEEAEEEDVEIKGMKETETLNAFHIISLSEGFNLSPLFEEKEELRFATTRPASSVISRIEELGKMKNFSVKKSESCVRLQGQRSGRKGKLGIAAEIFAVTPSFLVVEVKKSSGDTLEYNHFCTTELRPALKDIEWTSSGSSMPA